MPAGQFITNLFKVIRQPINLAFLASIALYSIGDAGDRNKATVREWTENLSVQLAEFSGKEEHFFLRERP